MHVITRHNGSTRSQSPDSLRQATLLLVPHALQNLPNDLQARAASEATSLPAEERSLFALTGIGMWTKLRPGVRSFLDGVAEFFELWIHTNGNRSARLTMRRAV